jgi:hypothetical protein
MVTLTAIGALLVLVDATAVPATAEKKRSESVFVTCVRSRQRLTNLPRRLPARG